MKKTKMGFFLFYGVVMTLLAGAYRYGIVMCILFVLIFSTLLLVTERMYNIIIKIGGKIYETFLHEKIEGYKKAKEQLRREE